MNEEIKSLLESTEWPQAIDAELICDPSSEEDKLLRAEGIVDLIIETSLTSKRFLDYGCGEGHVSLKALTKSPAISVGFDINQQWQNKDQDKLILTTDLDTVRNHGPYDIILLHDVIDHVDQPIEVLTNVKSLLSTNGAVYLRAHPFCSKHGTHLYHQLNKAYLHLILNEEEMNELGLKPMFCNKVRYPLIQYKMMLDKVGFEVVRYNILREGVNSFFKSGLIRQRIMNRYSDREAWLPGTGGEFPDWQCEQQFLDYVLGCSQ
jgi:SAM-dependent methyltransferase